MELAFSCPCTHRCHFRAATSPSPPQGQQNSMKLPFLHPFCFLPLFVTFEPPFRMLFRLGFVVCELGVQDIDTFLITLLTYSEFKTLNSAPLRNRLGPVPQALKEIVQETSKSYCQHRTERDKAKTNSPRNPANICTRGAGTGTQSIRGSKISLATVRTSLLALSLFFPEHHFIFLLKRNGWIKSLSQACGLFWCCQQSAKYQGCPVQKVI